MRKFKYVYILMILIIFMAYMPCVFAIENSMIATQVNVITLKMCKEMQTKLKALGYYYGDINGKIGSTRVALNKFFEDKGVTNSKGKVYVVDSSQDWEDLPKDTYKMIMETEKMGLSKLIRKNPDDKTLIAAIKDCKAYTAAHGFTYCYCRRAGIPLDKSERKDCTLHLISNKLPKYTVDCSRGVSASLYEYAAINENTEMKKYFKDTKISSNTYIDIGKKLSNNKKDNYFTLVDKLKNAKAGDILVYEGHVEFYAGSMADTTYPKVWNWGSNSSISTPKATTSSKKKSTILYILRVNEL